jgi:rhomboid protease GluP
MKMPEASRPDQPEKTCPKCGRIVESWAAICPNCEYEFPGLDPGMAPEQREEVREVAAFDAELEKEGPPPRVVYALIAINVLVFLVMAINGVNILTPALEDLFRWGANFPPVTVHGQWWRLLTSTFIHIGLIHIAFNMYVLWVGGRRMERILGHVGFTLTYLLSGLAGSVATLSFHPSAVGAGASGAIFGVYGALLGFLARDKASIPRPVFVAMGRSTLIFLAYNLVFSLKPGVDLSAHCGGLVAGFLCGLVLSRPIGESEHPSRLKLHGLTFLSGMLVIGILAAGVVSANREGLSGGAERVGVAGLEDAMKRILQKHFDSQKDISGVQVRKVVITRHEGKDYAGTAKLWLTDRELDLPLKVSLEGGNARWSLGAAPAGSPQP